MGSLEEIEKFVEKKKEQEPLSLGKRSIQQNVDESMEEDREHRVYLSESHLASPV